MNNSKKGNTSKKDDHARRVLAHLQKQAKQLEWDNYFCDIAEVVRQKSKDPSCKVGAVIVGAHREIRSTGYNGFPMGVFDSSERWERPTKYDYVAHAERNAVDLAARHGTSTDGCTLYLVAMDLPCCECAKTIIQAGIKEVVLRKFDYPNKSYKWSESAKITKEMFEESGVEYRYI